MEDGTQVYQDPRIPSIKAIILAPIETMMLNALNPAGLSGKSSLFPLGEEDLMVSEVLGSLQHLVAELGVRIVNSDRHQFRPFQLIQVALLPWL